MGSNCLECDSKCQTCFGTSTNCTSCSINSLNQFRESLCPDCSCNKFDLDYNLVQQTECSGKLLYCFKVVFLVKLLEGNTNFDVVLEPAEDLKIFNITTKEGEVIPYKMNRDVKSSWIELEASESLNLLEDLIYIQAVNSSYAIKEKNVYLITKIGK